MLKKNILKRKTAVSFMACLVMISVCIGTLTGCTDTQQIKKEGVIQVICTTFPAYDWTREIVGDGISNVEVSLLVENGADLHSYQATAADIAKISSCDVLVYVGGESEKWIEDVINKNTNPNMKAICLMNEVGDDILVEELVEGMQGHDHDEDDAAEKYDDDHKDGNSNVQEYDEHVWLSLENAKDICESIKNAMCMADQGNADIYEVNYRDYAMKLEKLDEKYEDMIEKAKRNTILFGDRFPFRYLVEDYDLNYYAAFQGCSAETEASFETIAFLAGKLDSEKIPVVLVIENSPSQIAETIIANTTAKNHEILTINSMQSVSKEDMESGVTYLGVMEDNLEVLNRALNAQ